MAIVLFKDFKYMFHAEGSVRGLYLYQAGVGYHTGTHLMLTSRTDIHS
jgi:hypothetical protein